MRLVSLVPSLTETLFALGIEDSELIGRTSWCVHPADRVASVRKLGGTKTPNIQRIIELEPDLVVLEREENPKAVWEQLVAAGIETYVAHVCSVDDVAPMLVDLGQAVGRGASGHVLAEAVRREQGLCVEPSRRPVAVPLIWHDPLMAVAPTRYAGDLVRSVGFDVPDVEPGVGYPQVTPRRIGEVGTEVLMLTSEPHDFTVEEGDAVADEVAAAGFARPEPMKVDGEALTWFGARTASAIRSWRRVLEATLPQP